MPANKSTIPGSTRIHESRVLSAPVSKVWEHVRPLTFSWLSTVKEVTDGKAGEVGSTRKVHYKDQTVQTIKIMELSDIEYFISYEVITSEPALTVSSALHTIRLRPVTHDNTTLIEWVSDFSNDATQEVLQDSKFKKQEGFEDLVKALASKKRAAESPARPSSPKKK